jgi:hypothetical protein
MVSIRSTSLLKNELIGVRKPKSEDSWESTNLAFAASVILTITVFYNVGFHCSSFVKRPTGFYQPMHPAMMADLYCIRETNSMPYSEVVIRKCR